MKSTQKGFTLSALVIGLLVLCVIGLAGWRVYDAGKSKGTQQSTDNQTNATDQPAETSAGQPTESTASQQKYLVIKEWSVKIPVDDSLASQASYTYNSANPFYAYLEVSDGQGGKCSAASLTRFDNDDIDPMTEKTFVSGSAMQYAKKVGNYYFVVGSPQAACSANPEDPKSPDQTTIPALKAAAKNIVAE